MEREGENIEEGMEERVMSGYRFWMSCAKCSKDMIGTVGVRCFFEQSCIRASLIKS
jgi:uncharacterized membrane protein YhdT